VWGLGVGGLGLGPKPPLPNPQSPIPNPQSPIYYKYLNELYKIFKNKIKKIFKKKWKMKNYMNVK
jgi:hypothetical protein